MKNKPLFALIITLTLSLIIVSTSAQAASFGSAFGSLSTARAVGQGVGNFGGGIGIADATSFFTSFTYGTSQYTDIKLKLGLIDADGSDTKFVLGSDFKWQYLSTVQDKTPVDLAFGGLFEYASLDAASVFQIGAFISSSIPIALKSGGSLSPYGRFNARLESISWDLPNVPGVDRDDSESNLEVGFHGGVEWRPTNTLSVYGEFQLDGNDGLFLGVDINVM